MKKIKALAVLLFANCFCYAQTSENFSGTFTEGLHELCKPGQIIVSPVPQDNLNVSGSANVVVKSATGISLKPGFSAGNWNAGGKFTATISNDCRNGYCGGGYNPNPNTPGGNSNEQQQSPAGIFDQVFDRFGTKYQLTDISINNVMAGGVNPPTFLCTNSGYFNLYFEQGSGMEDINIQTHNERRDVICQLFNDISAFIEPGDPNVRVNIWIRDIGQIPGIGNPSTSWVLGLATAFTTVPAGAPTISGIADNEVWKTIISGVDSYTNVSSPLSTQGGIYTGNSGTYFHGMMAFNFDNPGLNWHTNLSQITSGGLYDLYSVALHEVTHALGFASLIDANGLSKLGPNFNYYARYDLFLENAVGEPLLNHTGNCDLYNFGFNQSQVNTNELAPNPQNLTCSPNMPPIDDTDCNTAIFYDGSVTQEVYTPYCFEPPSSLSHFEDECINPPNDNLYFVMSNANGSGQNFMKRYLKPEERAVLCDLGYKVETEYSTVNSGYHNYVDYGGSTCPGIQVAGINDGLNNGVYEFTTTVGNDLVISGNQILNNDYNAIGFECLEDIYGNGTPSVTNGDMSTNITYTPTAGGTALLRYIPTSGNNKGNITYVFIRINSANCDASPCNMVTNVNRQRKVD